MHYMVSTLVYSVDLVTLPISEAFYVLNHYPICLDAYVNDAFIKMRTKIGICLANILFLFVLIWFYSSAIVWNLLVKCEGKRTGFMPCFSGSFFLFFFCNLAFMYFCRFEQMDPSLSGRGAEPVFRDKKG